MREDVHRMLERLVGGDSIAAAWLYDTFGPRLFRRLKRRYAYAGGPDPEDLLQDAYAFYFQNDFKVLRDFLDRVPPGDGAAEALDRHLWDLACGIATNRRRSAWIRRVLPLAEVPGEPVSSRAERRTIARDLVVQLERCLRDTSERIYLYFQLRYRDGLTPAEISSATGWSRKATYKLKEALNGALAECAEQIGFDR